MGWIGVLTNTGADMIAQLAGGSHTLTITKATIATGTVAEANLRTQTALTSEVGDISIVKKEEITGGVKIRVRVTPAASVGYTAHQIGIWGKIDNGTVKLIQIHQDSGTGIAIPTEAESPEFLFDYIAVLAVSNTSSLTVTVDPDVYASMDDLTDGLAEKLDIDQGSANAGKFMKVGNDGNLVPDNVPDPSGKADKVTGATSGDFAGLDANGNLTDSGKKASDFVAANQGSVNTGKFMKVGNDGNLVPDNVPDPTGKADKVSGATTGDFAGLDANGNLTDSGKKASDFVAANQGSGNSGKYMKVGSDGSVSPAEVQSGSTTATATLASGSWSSATPPTQTVSVTGVTASNNVIVGIASTITSTEYDAACAAKLVCTEQGSGTLTFTCYGDTPTENIPISVLIAG